jgi:glutaredoxin
MAHRVTLYSKPDCCLCEEVKDLLRQMQTEFSFALEEVDITSDPALHRRFQYLIPVVAIEGGVALLAPVDPVELQMALREAFGL